MPVSIINDKQLDQEMQVRCRKCPGCLRARQHLWRLRAEVETVQYRTWFFTGTWANQHCDIDRWNEETTRWLKRLRKRCSAKGVTVRYLMVPELHKSGMLHMHALVHQVQVEEDAGNVTYRDLKLSWDAGFADMKICDWRTAGYITKYTTKGLGENLQYRRPRLRSSRGYGAAVMERDPEKLKEMLRCQPNKTPTEVWTQNLQQIVREHQKRPHPLEAMK